MISRLGFLLKAIALVIFLFANNYSFSQENSAETAIDSSAKVPEAIPMVDVVQSLEDTNGEIKLAKKKIKPKESIHIIDSLFPAYSLFIQEQKIAARNFIKANPNRQKVDNLIKKWNGFNDHLSRWQSEVNDLVAKNVTMTEAISFDEKTWKLTYEEAIKENVPNLLLVQIKKTWNEINNIKKLIIKQSNGFLKLETKINNEKTIVNDVIDDLNVLKNSNVYDLFYLRHVPLWKETFVNKKSRKIRIKEQRQTFSKDIAGSIDYWNNNLSSIYLYILIIAFIVFLSVFLKRVFIKYPFNDENAELQRSKEVIVDNSLADIVFLSLFVANIFFANPPMLLANILFLATLIAALPIVWQFLYKRFKKVLFFIVLFYILDNAKTFIWFTSGQYRLYILFEALLVILVLFIFTYPYLKTRKMKIGKFGLILIRLTPILYALSLISVISNILGYTNLTDLTLKIVTRSGEITVVFYAILVIAGGISTGLIHYHFSKKKSYNKATKLKIELKALKIIKIVAIIAYSIIFLKMIDVYKPLIAWLTDMLSEPYKMGSITFTIGSILTFLLILAGSFILTSFISFIIDGDSFKVLKLPKGVPAAISLVIRYFIIAFGFVLALSALGIEFSKFNLMAGALGIGIGFGLQTIISNFVSGLILVFERPILVGDTVEVNNLLGKVSNIGVRASNIRTFDGAEVVVPNNNLISNDLINWTLSDNVKRVEILIGTTYGSDPNQILKILTEVATECEYALKDPVPHALFSEFGDSSLNFILRFWVHYENNVQSKSDVSIGIYNKFKKEGIEIPFPQQDVYIKDFPDQNKAFIETISKKKQIKETSVPEKSKNEDPKKPLVPDQTDDGLAEDGDDQN
jgi:small-conductance mechanosensitive channel